ncbi:MAG: UDP-N-acetylglucosamine--N-acetylmuramyl-(pentapeptide) pyrophosphoryl-undecaprenol N-acetylglucosamine transferase [Armatimonadetes bacterium]|nr:UDP-N-acetylglucosamine--N-acetylmuramyl-(pentapeptide) pyrophosphoryl-undecaprenol N-acetylglucosamine transferase [Armatimonadota bacterium]
MKRLVVTGGGTGGHVFPALETAQAAVERGWDVRYLGSLRGIEGGQCEKVGLPFEGFPSGPVYRFWTPKGVRSVLTLLKSTQMALRSLQSERAEAVFSTGGYASAPVVNAARKLGVPYWLHEQNTVPGRTNRLLSHGSEAVMTVFESTSKWFHGCRLVRTGMPIRRALRDSAQGKLPLTHSLEKAAPIVLVVGGSQGAVALNDVALATAVRMARTEVQWLHVTGLTHFESTAASLQKLAVRGDYAIKAYLDADEMASALFSCSVAVCRSGAGTLAELAAFRKPSILVPFPHAFGDHQRLNAVEFADMGAAEVLEQKDMAASTLEPRILSWINDRDARVQAEAALAKWDVPDAVERILDLIAPRQAMNQPQAQGVGA